MAEPIIDDEEISTDKLLKRIEKKVDLLSDICIKNGGGRHIIYNRTEFFQMLYDRQSLAKIRDGLYKYAVLLLILIQIIFIFIKK